MINTNGINEIIVFLINDSDINAFFHDQSLSIKATENKKDAYHEADFIIICVPTDFDEESSSFL